ncbi:MAG: hypothetical protein Q8916_04310 [Bacteroidota bacterium]|nr:hypothetical protein [Bacteroidota bacterium]MDP4229612.1 hypothetical protein [Bacteroidota bacterium]MDP4235847.1 hypothetical protein [Bacteroidota bacterium]
MKNPISLAIITFLSTLLGACASPNDPAQLPSNANDYFFQQNLTFQYTYSQDNASVIDTSTYQVSQVDNSYNSYLKLANKDQSNAGVLYYFKNVQAPDGSAICLLANSPTDQGYVALKGKLEIGASWFADTAQNIQATVVGKYEEYYLPGREVHYNDVVVVKYADNRTSSDNYVVRYFARYYGLILQRTITGPTSESSDLQLISFQGSVTSSNPDTHHDRWSNSNGRYQAQIRQADPSDK